MDNFSSKGLLQRPQATDLDVNFQFMPGPGKPPQGKGPSPTHTAPDIVSLKPGAQASPRPAAGSMMPPPCILAESSREFSRGMIRPLEGQHSSSTSIASSSQRHSLPQPEQSLNWNGVKSMRPPSRRRSATMDDTRQASDLQDGSHIPSLTINSERDASHHKGDRVQSLPDDHSMKVKTVPVTTPIAAGTNQWGLDLLDMGFDLPKDIPSSAQKRDSTAISTSREVNGSKKKQVRSLEFYETPQAKELEARLSELNSDKLAVKPGGNEVICISDDDKNSTPKQSLVVEKPSSGRKVGNLIQQQQHRLREMQRRNEAPNRDRQERTLSLHSSQGTASPQTIRPGSVQASSKGFQNAMQTGGGSLGQISGSGLGTMSGEQQLSIALTHLAAEKTALEMKLSRVNQEYLQQSTELQTLKQENAGLKSENQKFKSAVSSLKAQVSSVTEHVREFGNDLTQLGEEATLLRARVRGCIDEGISIQEEIQKAYTHATSIGERIKKIEYPTQLVRDMELQRDQAQGTTDLLRKELNDNVGELSLARERVTKLETLLENATQRTAKEKEQTEDAAGALAEIKESCISGFEELQTLLKSILDTNIGTAAQASGMEKLLTCLIKTEVTEMVNGVVGGIKQEMRQGEKRIRRIALGGGIRVMDKLVTATEALEKLFKQECEGIMKTLDDSLVRIREDTTNKPEYVKAICFDLESVAERVKSISTETKDIHNIAINDRQYISHLVGQNESLLERIKLLESKSEELAVVKINKIQVEKDLGESQGLCDRMSRELEGLKELGKENIKSIAYLEKQLETALAVPKEDPSVIATLRSNMEKLEGSMESSRTMIADKEQQVVAKDRQIEDLTVEFLALKKINETLKEKTGAFEEERRKYESVLKSQYEEEKASYLQNAFDERNAERISVEKKAQRLCEKIRVEAQNSIKMLRTDNAKLQSEYTQEVSKFQLQLSDLSADKAALESKIEAARDLVRNLESELETLRTSNFEEKLNQADLEVLSLKREIEQMQRRVETGSGSLNLALNTIYMRDERGELNRSLEDAIAEVQSLCQEVSIRTSKKFIENGTCMDSPKAEERSITHVASTPPPVQQPPSTTEPQLPVSTAMDECIPATPEKRKPSEASPAAGKKRVKNESHETPSMLPPRAKRPRHERPKREVEKGEGSTRTATGASSPTGAGPKRKRAPTKRG